LASHDLTSFEQIFKEYFKPLCGFAGKYVRDRDEAKAIVHDVFVAMWERRDSLPADVHHRSYLYTAVRNRCLNFVRDRKKLVPLETIPREPESLPASTIESEELAREIEFAINTLPAKCREIFELNRRDGKKYSEIADQLGISLKTVEAQISKALSVLRTHLGDFLILIIFFIYG
jgi:RNA polymerase sigma-70 factor, ECF subfamily